MVECESSTAMLTEFVDFCFNRYMVECEYVDGNTNKSSVAVLIDTWWNVNLTNKLDSLKLSRVLIDTWWNVNFPSDLFNAMILSCFNRYMVECE